MAARTDLSPRAMMRHKRQLATPRKGNGTTPRVRKAIEAIVHGIPGEERVTMKRAAEFANLKPRALRAALRKPGVLEYYRAEVQSLREGERAANLRTAIEVRDDAGLKGSAAGQKVRLAAAAQLDADLVERGGGGPNVNLAVGVKVDVPGYVIDLSPWPDARTIEHEVSDDEI